MNKNLQIAVILTAIDNLSGVVNSGVNSSISSLNKFNDANKKFAQGFALIGAGQAGFDLLKKPIQTFADFETEATRLKSNLLDRNGIMNPEVWKRVNDEAIKLGNQLPGNTADFYKMFNTLKSLGIDVESIIGGTAQATAYLANVIGESYDSTADAVGRMKNATGVADKDMMRFLDNVAKAKNVGVNMHEMETAFSNSGNQLKFLGLQGIEATEKMTRFYAMFIKQGVSGQKVGTTFARMMSEMLNPKKYEEMQAAANKYGITLDFLDKKGNFAGVDNMIAQFTKLNGTTNDKVVNIFKGLTGGEGFDDQIAKSLAKGSGVDWSSMNKAFDAQAGMEKKQQLQLGTLNAKWEQFTGTIDNAMASIGNSANPQLNKLIDNLNWLVTKIQEFLSTDFGQKVAGIAVAIVAVVSAILLLAGTIRIIQGISAAWKLLNTTMAANPIILAIMLIIAAIALIYIYWEPIKQFFSDLWTKTKLIFSKAWEWIKNMFLNYTPLGLVIKNWDKITKFFSDLWDNVKTTFSGWVDWVMGLGSKFLEAGQNIVNSIWQGIKNFAHKPIEAIQDIAKKMRDYLPFSPAKVGALRDIHKIKLVETIAANIKAGPMLDAMNRATGSLFNGLQQQQPTFATSGQNNFHFSATIHMAPGGNQGDANKLMGELQPALDKWWKEKLRNDDRRKL